MNRSQRIGENDLQSRKKRNEHQIKKISTMPGLEPGYSELDTDILTTGPHGLMMCGVYFNLHMHIFLLSSPNHSLSPLRATVRLPHVAVKIGARTSRHFG